MRVLIACEFSGIVREAFRKLGHDAWSCDLLPTEIPGQHIQGDVFDILAQDNKWDMLIHFWPCTLLCNSGVRWLNRGSERRIEMMLSAGNFRRLMDWGIPKTCGENPIPHKYARAIMGDYTQTIQPYEHGHGETKRTCLWLRGLPLLKPSNLVAGRIPRVHYMSPGPNRWKERSRTLPGIAEAMAQQWGNLCTNSTHTVAPAAMPNLPVHPESRPNQAVNH